MTLDLITLGLERAEVLKFLVQTQCIDAFY